MTKKDAGKAALAAGLMMGMAAAADAQHAPVKVGVIDTPVERIYMFKQSATIQSRSFLDEDQKPGSVKANTGQEHGEVVATAFVQQSRAIESSRRVEIYSATTFYQTGNTLPNGQKEMRLNYAAAERALDWFDRNGVRNVVAAFYTNDNAKMRAFMDKAKSLNITVFAGTNNDPTQTVPFPARHPYAIAVTGSNANLDFSSNPSMREWTAFKVNGDVPAMGADPTAENGSSYAVARAAAFGAHYTLRFPGAQRDEIAAAMRGSGRYSAPARIHDLTGDRVAGRFIKDLGARAAMARVPAMSVALADALPVGEPNPARAEQQAARGGTEHGPPSETHLHVRAAMARQQSGQGL